MFINKLVKILLPSLLILYSIVLPLFFLERYYRYDVIDVSGGIVVLDRVEKDLYLYEGKDFFGKIDLETTNFTSVFDEGYKKYLKDRKEK